MKKYPLGNEKAYAFLEKATPIYTYLFIDALAKASLKNGIAKEEAYKIAIQLVLGSAKLVNKSEHHPWKLVDMVCSPGGTTIEGVASLQADAFESKITQVFDYAI